MPIPDEVLRDFIESKRELVKLPGYGVVSCSDMGQLGEDLARELLALREAVKDADSKCVNKYDCGGCAPCVDAWARIRALLPEEPK